jgi:methionyl-tRNA formyltransferase
MKVAFCGYDFFYDCFEAVLAKQHTILKLFSYDCDNRYVFNTRSRNEAERLGIPIQAGKMTSADLEWLESNKCDLLLAAAYPYRLPTNENFRLKSINIHPTLLPEGRGSWPLPHLILKEVNPGGVTIHKVAHEFDVGDILLQEAFEIGANDNLESISCKCQMLAKTLLVRLLDDLDTYWSNAKPQSDGSYWAMPTAEDRTLDWSLSINELDRRLRAFGKFECFAHFDNQDWLVQDATCWIKNHSYELGAVVHRTSLEYVVAARDGFVCIRHFSKR